MWDRGDRHRRAPFRGPLKDRLEETGRVERDDRAKAAVC
jgi:hypothetical protein